MTADGWIAKTHKLDGNTLHLVSLAVILKARGMGIGKKLLLKRMQLAKKLKLKFIVVNIRVPSYADYCKKKGKINIQSYVKEKKDPLLNMYLKQGFEIKKIIKNDFPDKESKNYGIFMMKNA